MVGAFRMGEDDAGGFRCDVDVSAVFADGTFSSGIDAYVDEEATELAFDVFSAEPLLFPFVREDDRRLVVGGRSALLGERPGDTDNFSLDWVIRDGGMSFDPDNGGIEACGAAPVRSGDGSLLAVLGAIVMTGACVFSSCSSFLFCFKNCLNVESAYSN